MDMLLTVVYCLKEIAQETALYREIISRLENGWKPEENLVDIGKIDGEIKWTSPIPVLVFVCNRAQALKQHVDKLLKYRPSSDLYPIIISQDCDSNEVTEVVRSYGSAVHYIKHLSGEKANIEVGPDHQRYITYYMIARHYKLGLDYVFNNKSYTSVIITEDDLDIAPDFFNYFSSTRELLDKDPTLFCVSAWNDNGKSNLINMDAGDLLYRSDFFPGLGWMMTRKLWDELGPIWPNGFWDDWIRDPLRRKNRACIRPEISRTAMTVEGRKGASKGLFFAKHLGKITLNVRPIDFTKINLDYLIKDKYDEAFLNHVYSTPLITLPVLQRQILVSNESYKEYRVEYSTLTEYLSIADALQIMRDFKAGVPRTAYYGVVTCFINKKRIYVAPNRSVWKTYDPHWEAPDNPNDLVQQ
uniref:Alpha-1,3-mannosyl-glycoprotein 2-beta-N-acetylglucosaminyltransferase n=1 Tax=Syphacia muris TaxID=451379 RepID=A0A0N5AA13_9BILA